MWGRTEWKPKHGMAMERWGGGGGGVSGGEGVWDGAWEDEGVGGG